MSSAGRPPAAGPLWSVWLDRNKTFPKAGSLFNLVPERTIKLYYYQIGGSHLQVNLGASDVLQAIFGCAHEQPSNTFAAV